MLTPTLQHSVRVISLILQYETTFGCKQLSFTLLLHKTKSTVTMIKPPLPYDLSAVQPPDCTSLIPLLCDEAKQKGVSDRMPDTNE